MIVDFLNGRMFGYMDTGMNVVDVEDVAVGHLLAAERGRIGERYILGGENLPLKAVLDLLADVSGRPKVRRRIPPSVALAWSYVDVTVARLNPRHVPAATPEKVRLSRQKEYYDSSKAMRELGYSPGPAREALRKAVEWAPMATRRRLPKSHRLRESGTDSSSSRRSPSSARMSVTSWTTSRTPRYAPPSSHRGK